MNEYTGELLRLSRLLDDALAETQQQVRDFAQAEMEYRKAKARAWLQSPQGTVPERDAWVNGETADLRHRRDLADGLRQAALEAVRSRRAQLSALQSLMALQRSEAELDRYGQTPNP